MLLCSLEVVVLAEFLGVRCFRGAAPKASANKPLSIQFVSGLSNEAPFLNKRLFR